jgi:spore maturation protein SpmA
MNQVFFGLVALAFAFAVWNGTPAEVGQGAMDAAKGSVDLALGLVGYIALFLGLMKVVEEAGGLKFVARIVRPVMVLLFPNVPPEHPAMGAMVMNVAANALGLGNAATPFGLKAMKELNDLNTEKGTATNAMILFLAINTSGLAILPTGIIGVRALKGSTDAAAIFPTTLLATACSTIVGITAAILLSRLPMFSKSEPKPKPFERPPFLLKDLLPFLVTVLCMIGLVFVVWYFGEQASAWILPVLIVSMLSVGFFRGVRVYEVFVKGAKEGFDIAVMIIPYLVAILSAVGMLRASGGLGRIVEWVRPVTEALGIPGEVLPLALLRPLSGSGAFGITAELLDTYTPDSLIGNIASTMVGSTETTFYVLAVYFGSIGVTKIRHAVPAGLAADITGVLASCWAVHWLLT